MKKVFLEHERNKLSRKEKLIYCEQYTVTYKDSLGQRHETVCYADRNNRHELVKSTFESFYDFGSVVSVHYR